VPELHAVTSGAPPRGFDEAMTSGKNIPIHTVAVARIERIVGMHYYYYYY